MNPDENGGGTAPIEAPSKVVINGVEYDPNEAQNLIETGRKTKEYETKYNTSFDKVWPEYNTVSQEKARLAKELEQAKTTLASFEQKKDAGVETQTDVAQARAAAKKLGIILDEDIKDKFISKDDFDKVLEERLTKREQEKAQIKQVLDQADSLEKEIDGSDGRPKFNKKIVLAYANAYGHSDLKAAYEDMHKETLDAWKATQIDSKKSRGLKTFSSGGGKKEPTSPKIDDSNVKGALSEALWGGNE